MKSQQNIMLIVMPIMMTWMTTSLSAGVGIYWITSSVYQTVQQVLLNRYYTRDGSALVAVVDGKQPKEIITLDKSRNKKGGEIVSISVEKTAKTVDDAIAEALKELKIGKDEADINRTLRW